MTVQPTPTKVEIIGLGVCMVLIGCTVGISLKSGFRPLSPSAAPVHTQGQSLDELKAAIVKIDIAVGGKIVNGTGTLITSNGWVLTNNHVVEVVPDREAVHVTLPDGRSFQGSVRFTGGTVCSTSPKCLTDIALIKLDGAAQELPYAELSDRPPEEGDRVVALGYVGGVDRLKMTQAVLEAPFPDGTLKAPARFVAPGNSGGPVSRVLSPADLGQPARVEVVGIAVGMNEVTGVGKALPIEGIVQFIADSKGEIKRAVY